MLTHSSFLDSLLPDLQYFKPIAPPDPLWAFNEFATARFNDLRLTHRCQCLARDFANQPVSSIPQACVDWSGSKAAYRFFSNNKVSFEAILAAHSQQTLQRLGNGSSSVVLCPQDTTSLNYSHLATPGLGPVGTRPGKSLGLLLHSTLALTPEGQFVGILQARCWARPNRKKSKRARSRHQKAIHEKESGRWVESFNVIEYLAQRYPQQQWVSVGDREADIFQLYKEATRAGVRAQVLIRARHDRPLCGKKRTLFKHMRKLTAAGQCVVQIPRHHQLPAREALLSVSFETITLRTAHHCKEKGPITLWAVFAREILPPSGLEPICWHLLTTAPVTCLDDAIERIEWYVKRWRIEEFHRVLKSGCQAEARQLCSAQRLKRVLALDMVVAWRIMDINKAARLEPESPADRWFSTEEWQALYCYVNQCPQPPKEPPTIRQMVHWLAQLGGFLARKGDGQPGNTTLWRGLKRLNDIVAAWHAFGPGSPPNNPKKTCKKIRKRCG